MIVSLYTSLALLMAALANASPVGTKKSIRVQGHRGGIGLRPENTLQAFAYSLELGVDVLEMDMLFTKDGVVCWGFQTSRQDGGG